MANDQPLIPNRQKWIPDLQPDATGFIRTNPRIQTAGVVEVTINKWKKMQLEKINTRTMLMVDILRLVRGLMGSPHRASYNVIKVMDRDS